MLIEDFIKYIGAATGFIAFIFATLKIYQWLYPLKITPCIHFPCEEFKHGAIVAEIVNKSREAQYIVRCEAVGVNTFQYIIRKHLSHPFCKPRLYPTIWYGPVSLGIINKEKIKIEPYEPREFTHILADNFLSYFYNPLFLIEVELSTGRVLHSKRQLVPGFLQYKRSKYAKNTSHV